MFYAVAKGKNQGVYKTWNECKKQVKGFKGAKFRKFNSKEAAQNFISEYSPTTNLEPQKQSKISNFFKVNVVPKPVIKDSFNPDFYVYTDGACSNNGRKNAKASIGIYFGNGDPRNKSERVIGKQTNNTAELTAIIKAYTIIKDDLDAGKKVCIATDSEYSIKCATKYGKRMSKENWKKNIPNKELVKKIYELYGNNANVKFKHVRAHTSNTDIHSIGNDHADRLANEAIGLTSCPYT